MVTSSISPGFVGPVFEDAHKGRGLRACVHRGECVVSVCVVLCNSQKTKTDEIFLKYSNLWLFQAYHITWLNSCVLYCYPKAENYYQEIPKFVRECDYILPFFI